MAEDQKNQEERRGEVAPLGQPGTENVRGTGNVQPQSFGPAKLQDENPEQHRKNTEGGHENDGLQAPEDVKRAEEVKDGQQSEGSEGGAQ